MENLAKRFPKITKLVTVATTEASRNIYAIEITQMHVTGAAIVIDAGMDMTDRTGVTFAIFIIHQLLERLNNNLLTLYGVKIVIVPLVNPDAYSAHLEVLKLIYFNYSL